MPRVPILQNMPARFSGPDGVYAGPAADQAAGDERLYQWGLFAFFVVVFLQTGMLWFIFRSDTSSFILFAS